MRSLALATLLTVISVALFVRLGFWQLHRADEKRTLLEQYDAGQQSTVELTPENAHTLTRYQRVHARGHYDAAHQILLDNMPSKVGWPGYRVVTPFQLVGGSWLLIDRGWIPMGKTRDDIPDVPVEEDVRGITGLIDHLPRAGISLGEASSEADVPWPHVMSFPQTATLEQALARRLLPGVVLLDPAQPDGYERQWQARLPEVGPGRHIAYAVQWFAFAVTALTLYLVLTLRRRPSSND
jgi:surfeit locus 1 family protein